MKTSKSRLDRLLKDFILWESIYASHEKDITARIEKLGGLWTSTIKKYPIKYILAYWTFYSTTAVAEEDLHIVVSKHDVQYYLDDILLCSIVLSQYDGCYLVQHYFWNNVETNLLPIGDEINYINDMYAVDFSTMLHNCGINLDRK